MAIEDENESVQTERNIDQLFTNGAVVLPSLLPSNTTRKLREVIISKNKGQSMSEQFFVLNHDHRYSLVTSIHHDHDPIHDPDNHLSQALSLIASNTKLRALLTSALQDSDPSLVEMSAITVLYGAEAQPWHADTLPESSSTLFGNTYSDLYTVFVALQDTTNEMGATELCLGTHMCSIWDEEYQYFVPNSNNDGGGEWQTSSPHMCDQIKEYTLSNGTTTRRTRGVQVPLKAGDAFVYNSELIHRGKEHVDPLATERVQLLLSFTSRPMQRLNTDDSESVEIVDWRALPNGATYSLKYDSWGSTMSNMMLYKQKKSSLRRRLGLDSSEGWRFLNIYANRCQRYHNSECKLFDLSNRKLIHRVIVLVMCTLFALLGYAISLMREVVNGSGASKSTGKDEVVVKQAVVQNTAETMLIQKRVVIRSSTIIVVRNGVETRVSSSGSSIVDMEPCTWKTFRPLLVFCGLSSFIIICGSAWVFLLAPSAIGAPPSLPHLEMNEGLGIYSDDSVGIQSDLRWLHDRSMQLKYDNKKLNISRDDVIVADSLQVNLLSDVQAKKLYYHTGNVQLRAIISRILYDELKQQKKKEKLISDASARRELLERILKNELPSFKFWKVSGDRRQWTLMKENDISSFVDGLVLKQLKNKVADGINGDSCTA